MKNSIVPFLLVVVLYTQTQAQQLKPLTKYRRSSLYTLMINDNSRQFADAVKTTFISAPIPDKFNDHNLAVRHIDAEAGAEEQDQNIQNYLASNNVARNMVAKWFNRSKKGAFNMNLVADRGSYNASEMDANKAKLSKRGLALLADAGEELIANTFVLVNDYKYVSKEEIAKYTAVGLQVAGGILSAATGNKAFQTAADVGTVGVAVAGKGYVIKTTSYLYKLVWNDSISAVFYNEYWTDSLSFDANKKAAFDNSNIFRLELVGSQVAWADVQSTIFTQKSDEDLVKIATVRATDAVIAKLQKKYEIFRTKTPLYSTDTLAAKIGLKESLEGGDKFTVLEQAQTEEGKTVYNKIGVIKVDGENIWDNRHMAGVDTVKATDKTLFKKVNGKDFYPGLLIMQK